MSISRKLKSGLVSAAVIGAMGLLMSGCAAVVGGALGVAAKPNTFSGADSIPLPAPARADILDTAIEVGKSLGYTVKSKDGLLGMVTLQYDAGVLEVAK